MRAVVGNSRIPIASRVDLTFGMMLAGRSSPLRRAQRHGYRLRLPRICRA